MQREDNLKRYQQIVEARDKKIIYWVVSVAATFVRQPD